MGAPAFEKVLGIIPNGTKIANIEKLLTQCKLYAALYGNTDANGKLIAEFITTAEDANLARVDFVDAETDLVVHQGNGSGGIHSSDDAQTDLFAV